MATRKGNTLFLDTAPSVISYGAVGSKKESEGPLAAAFDRLWEDSTLGEETWEKAECRLQKEAIRIALEKGELSPKDLQVIFAGDLLNQCTSSTYGLRELGDQLKEKLVEGVVVLISDKDGKVNMIAMATQGAMDKGAHAGNLIKGIAALVGGGGGGRPNMAQAGGKNPAGIDAAIAESAKVLEGQIG